MENAFLRFLYGNAIIKMDQMKRRAVVLERLQKLNKDSCGTEMTTEESRRIQLDMLRALAAFCDENGLRYFLSGGTLLGAIRHHGFIPWDDDIDVNMPRTDCERLLQLTDGRLDRYRIVGPDMDGFCPLCESYRIYDPTAVIESWAGGYAKEPYYLPVFADIFPIEGLPDGEWQTRLHYDRIVFARKMQRVSVLKHMEARSLSAHIFHVLAWIPARLVGYTNWSRLVQKIATAYSMEEKAYIGVMTAPRQTTSEKVKKEDYLHAVPVLFEGNVFHAPSNYDVYLHQLYGDYMRLPPEEKRRSDHVFHMYWNRQNADQVTIPGKEHET